MLGAGFDVVSADTKDPAALNRQLGKADLVMLDDLAAESLPTEIENKLVDAVKQDGLGLVMSGGRAAFGAGGWHARPIESLLPVELVQKEEKRDPSTSLVIVIDTSGSMSGIRVQLAKEVARLTMRRLLPHDKVGIVEFYGAKRWAAPLQPASNAIELQRALNRMDAGGGTVILPALEESFYGLQNVDTRYKHVIVLTDGGVESGDFESLMRRMAGEGINVSTVLCGGGYHSEFLVNIANWGKGRFYNVPNRFNLPEILLKQPSTTKLPSYRPGSHAVRARSGAGWWGDVDMSELPNLAGYVESKSRVGSEVLLETALEKHPILSTWRYGLGRVTALTTEPTGNGTTPWQQWPDYSKALSRILQRSAADARDPFQFKVEHDGGKVIVHAIRQQSRSAQVESTVAESLPLAQNIDTSQSLTFMRRSPDRFVAFVPAPKKGETMRIETSSTSTPDRRQPLVVRSAVVEESFVDRETSVNLGQLAATTGGQQFAVSGNWADAPSSTPSGKTLWSPAPWLFAIALLLFLAEIIWRRLPNSLANRGSRTATAAVLLLCCCMAQPSSAQDVGTSKSTMADSLVETANELIETSMQDHVDRDQVGELFREALLTEGNVAGLLDWLEQARGDITKTRGQVIAEIEVHVASRRGDLQRASDVLGNLLAVKSKDQQRTDLQIWNAKLFDALGNVDEAQQIYESLAKQDLNKEDQQSVRLRLALIGLIGAKQGDSKAKPLIELAQASDDPAFRNRAANVLAVQNQHAEALKLFTIEGKGTIRFRNASRVTEWAIRAKKRDKAIETAWESVDSAELRRDRNYALSLLVESYRLEKKKEGLEQLVEKFAERNSSDQKMTNEMRTVWINLLRELGRHDDAIKLFKSTATDDSGFSVEMRRELLEMEGEAGNEEQMMQSYRELIQSQPNEMTWRTGLTQILLEKGQDAQAELLWQDFVNESTRGSVLLLSAQTLGEFGMDELAKSTIERMVALKANHGQALLYWSDLQQRRGNVAVAEETLDRIFAMDDAADDVRAELASAYERIGRQDRAIEVNEAIRASRETVAEDLELRLAWLYSEIGDEDKALEQWMELWKKVTSIPRRRYVEDRLMTVASRLGTLADIAIELEEKLADGTADAREAGLLIRIYSRVNDSVAATEISEQYMSKTGKNEVEQLQEKGRIYQVCNDYWNYEKVIERLILVDPKGETEYLRQLALSMLERGKAQEARAVLMTLRDADDGKDSIGGEFEAGVLSLVGMNAEAASAYRKGIAMYPDRIESYLLLANLLKEMGQTDRAIGMFQYLAENADRDDMFTIAIDGILNMEARGNVMQWARRITLERLAGREDKNYLYQLLSDLSSEVNDKSGQIRAMENSLAVSGTRRLSVLRECMELSSKIRGGSYYSSSSRGPTNKGNSAFFAFGRRLIGLGELIPPQVFLDLGQAFLDDGDTSSAERTFAMARNLADPRDYQRQVASIFEKADKIPESLVRYEKLLRTSPSDVALIARVAKLNEKESKDDVAFRFYQRGLNLLLSQTPLTSQEQAKQTSRYYGGNRDTYQTYSDRLMKGLLVTLPDDQIDGVLDTQRDLLGQSLKQLQEGKALGRIAEKITDSPRVDRQSSMLQQLYRAFDRIDDWESMNAVLINQFPEDKSLLTKYAGEYIGAGRYDVAERMLDTQNPSDAQRKRLLTMLGKSTSTTESGKLSPQEMWRQLLPAWMNDDTDAAKKILRRVDQSKGRAPSQRPSYVVVNGVAVRQTAGSAANVAPWMRLALLLGDEGLALQFARSRLKSFSSYGTASIKQLFTTYERILPKESFADLVRYAANLYKDDKNRLTSYLWLVSEMREHLGDDVLDDEEIVKRIQDSSLSIGYSFPFGEAVKVIPESIRSEAIAELLDRIAKKSRPRELIRVLFAHDKPIDAETSKVLLESIESGIAPAMQDNYLRYLTYALPRKGTAVQCPENADLAIAALELLMTDEVRKREDVLPRMAEFIKAVVLHQNGDTDAALDIILDSYDPKENISDYYLRYSRDWVYRELIPGATNRFVELVDQKVKDGKPTTAQTDERLKLIKQAKDDNWLRRVYKQAIKDHPTQTKYVTEYERWEQQQKRTFAVIELYEQRLKAAQEKDSDNKAASDSIKKKLATLWMSVNHLPKGLPHWSITDDAAKKSFEEAKKKRSEKKVPTKVAAQKDEPKTKPKPAEAKKKTYKTSMAGVKDAIDDEDLEAAQQTIRKMWRQLPPAVEPRYHRNTNKKLNGLTWPKDKSTGVNKTVKVEPSEEEKKAAKQKARLRARGGLATFTPEKREPPKKGESAWKKLAEHPFAVAEMRRIMRSHATSGVSRVQDVSIALSQVDQNENGDEAAFESLVQKIHKGHVSDEVLLQFFAMLDENPKRINEDNQSVIDVLMERLDLTDSARASQLADLCGRVGQKKRAAALYRHCALMTSSGTGTITGLIAKARETFDGGDLIELVESMYDLSNQSASEATEMLKLRLELLDPKEAADRSRDSFDGDLTADNSSELQRLIHAVPVFARSGEIELANKCLAVVIYRYGKPLVQANQNSYYYSSNSSRSLLRVSRADLIRMFPADTTGYQDNTKWLQAAAEQVAQSYQEDDCEADIVLETLLTIAIRQLEADDMAAAKKTLSKVSDGLLTEAKKHESLVIDVMRKAGQTDRALAIQKTLYQQQQLSHLRFDDFLRDTNATDGLAAAAKLLEELVEKSMDEDLLAAATEIAGDDEALAKRASELSGQQKAAQEEYDARRQAAKERAETRKQWIEQDKAAKAQ